VGETALILLGLGLATAFLPVQLIVTVLMLNGPRGRSRAAAWIGGMTVVRLAQYALFGLVLEAAVDDGEAGTSAVEGALLLVVAVVLLVAAARKASGQPDEDAPPPAWMGAVASATPGRAFLMGGGLVALSPKLWAITLAAIGAIGDADPSLAGGWLAFVAWIAVAQGAHLALLLLAVVAPVRAAPLLAALGETLQQRSRPITVGVGVVFGLLFLVKALGAFGLV
jgi:hypothetical protein